MNLAREIKKEHVEQLAQLLDGVIWDGDLISKDARDWLFNRQCVMRHDGYNFVAVEGVKLARMLGMLKK